MQLVLIKNRWTIIPAGDTPHKDAEATVKINLSKLVHLAKKAHENGTGISRDGALEARSLLPLNHYRATIPEYEGHFKVKARTEKRAKFLAFHHFFNVDSIRNWPRPLDIHLECLGIAK